MKRNGNFVYMTVCIMVAVLAVVLMGCAPALAEVDVSGEIDGEAVSVLRECVRYVDSHDFTATLTGDIEARVFGIRYRQKVCGTRGAHGGEYFDRTESTSSFVKAAVEKRSCGNKCSVCHGDFRRGEAVYGEPEEMEYKDFVAAYGYPRSGLVKYEWKNALLSAEKKGEGEYVFRLDPQKSTVISRNGVRTALGTDSYPTYSAVELTLYTENGLPTKTVCRETMRIDKFGGTECKGVYTEQFNFGGTCIA